MLDVNHESLSIGFAPSNLSNYLNPGFELPAEFKKLSVLAASNQMGFELELEGDIDSIISLDFTKPAFLGVHQPIVEIDVVDNQRRAHSIEQIKRTMALAAIIKADYFTNHLQTVDHWDGIAARRSQIETSLDAFDKLWAHHSRSGYNFPMLIENLEYPKYPATINEIMEIVEYLHLKVPIPSGIVLDIGHLWRSRELIKLAPEEQSTGDESFTDYLEATLAAVGSNIKVFHITGCRDEHTHLMPEFDNASVVFNTETQPESDYDFRAIGSLIFRFAAEQSESPYLVNEAFGYPYKEVIRINHNINDTFRIHQ